MLKGKDPDWQMKHEISRLIQKNKSKAPIVYLRSFSSERLRLSDITKGAFVGKSIPGTMAYWRNVGEIVTDFLRVIGPVKALARPKTAWGIKPWAPSPPEFVAVDNDQWQQQILEWLPQAPLVVVQLDASPGLGWELQQLTLQVRPTRVLLVLPATQAEYDSIRAETRPFFLKPLPEDLPASRLMTFRPGWQPWPLLAAGGGGHAIWQTLEPIFEQNGYESPPWRLIYGIGPLK